jgi:hypothetical protein
MVTFKVLTLYFIHAFQHLFQACNLWWKTFTKCPFTTVATLLWISSSDSNLDPFKVISNFETRKSHKSVQWMFQNWYFLFSQKLFYQCALWKDALPWFKIHLSNGLIFLNKKGAVNFPKLESKMLHWLFWRKTFIMDNSFWYKINRSAWFCLCFWHHAIFDLLDWHFASGSYWKIKLP